MVEGLTCPDIGCLENMTVYRGRLNGLCVGGSRGRKRSRVLYVSLDFSSFILGLGRLEEGSCSSPPVSLLEKLRVLYVPEDRFHFIALAM